MTDERIDQILQQALSPMTPDERINRNLKKEMEDINMKKKRFSVKKGVILAAACCLLVGTVSVASSGAVVTIVSGGPVKEYKSFAQLDEAEQETGFEIKALEEFRNGYTLKKISVDNNYDLDADENVIAKYKEIDLIYEKDGAEKIYISTMQEANVHKGERMPDQTIGIGGIQIDYCVDHYKWVPVGYELTDEDKQNLERDDFFISEGADEISESKVSHASWVQDGVYYLLMAYDEVPAEIFMEMAEELIALP